MLFEKNRCDGYENSIKKKLKFDNSLKMFIYILSAKNGIFCGDHVIEIIRVINYTNKVNGLKNVPIVFRCRDLEFYDKLVYVMVECIAYYLLIEKKQNCYFDLHTNSTIWSEGIFYSPLNVQGNPNEYKKLFYNDIKRRHFRKVVNAASNIDGPGLSALYQEITWFLRNNGVSESNSDTLAEVLTELVANSIEHAYADTLIDIDLTDTTYTRANDDNTYYGMNTAIISFSPTLFYEPLKIKMDSSNEYEGKYTLVKQAYDYHKQHFSEIYDENDFYTISSFQDKISGSLKKKMGGRGLTTLLKSLEEQAETHLCYMYTDNRITFLSKELLAMGENQLIGFNKEANYMSKIPDEDAFGKINTVLPGTAYNLSFVIKKEWSL